MKRGTEDYSFSRFADLDFYKTINARLLEIANIGEQQRIVDLGCGTGGVTRLILDRLAAARQSWIYAIDHSAAAIRQAISELGDRRDAVIKFIQGDASTIREKIDDGVDAVVYCNAIHYVPDKERLLQQISDSLRPGGIFAFNSSFFRGSHPPESEDFYRRWMMKSLRILRREYNLKPVKTEKTEARRHLSADDYCELVEAHGLKVERREIMPVDVPLEGWLNISTFSDFIEGTFPGVPISAASESLQRGAADTYDELEIDSVKRHWLHIVASRG